LGVEVPDQPEIETLLVIVAGYLAGSLPFGYWVVRLARGDDIRRHGSGNVGATNVWRTFGRRLGVSVALLDLAKGFAPTLVATLFAGHLAGALTGAAAMLGHWRPLFLGFARGGKAVATCGGAFFGLAPLVGLAGLIAWLVVFAATRYASVSSMLAAASLPVVALLLDEPWPVLVFSIGATVAVLLLHRANLARLRAGTETRVQLRRRQAGPSHVP
jgi:acyl phosphate:glycerol-3-phosphate acyltransferase